MSDDPTPPAPPPLPSPADPAAGSPPEPPVAVPAPSGPPEPYWQRLDPRTLLTGPFAVIRAAGLPILIAAFGLGGSGGMSSRLSWAVVGLFGAGLFGLVPWLTTTYRVTTTHIEMRSGLLNRTTVTARRDRVRSVDLEASALHRILGLTRAIVGTGSDEGQIRLDSLAVSEAETLRATLLHDTDRSDASGGTGDTDGALPATDASYGGGAAVTSPVELARLDWRWLRFAPLNLGEMLIGLAGIAVFLQFTDMLTIDEDDASTLWDWLAEVGAIRLLTFGIPIMVVAWIGLSLAGFVLRWAGLRVTREMGKEGPTLHRVYGLLTKRATTVEEAKVRGATMTRPVLVGLAGGATLSLLTNGLEDNQPHLLPSAPHPDVLGLADDVLGGPEPMESPLTGHGPRARRRFWVQNLLSAGFFTALAAAWAWGLDERWWPHRDVPAWTPVIVLVFLSVLAGVTAELRFARLGHTLTTRYLVSQTGTWGTQRVALESDGIVGWRIHQGVWDRLRGLSQLTATTAAGPEAVLIPDVPLVEAVRVAAEATPAFLAEFVD